MMALSSIEAPPDLLRIMPTNSPPAARNWDHRRPVSNPLPRVMLVWESGSLITLGFAWISTLHNLGPDPSEPAGAGSEIQPHEDWQRPKTEHSL